MARSRGYRQFCPIALAAEVLGERWTALVVRELLCGSLRFNDIQRGVPRMSSALLSRRLKELEQAGIVKHHRSADGRAGEYRVTASGRELLPVLETMGNWAQRWLRHELTAPENLDPDLLMWDVRRRAVAREVPRDGRFVVQFHYEGVPASHRFYWLVFDDDGTDLCVKDPGFEVRLLVRTHIRTMSRIWLGHLDLGEAIRSDRLRLEGSRADIAAFRRWFALSLFAEVGRREVAAAAS
ncbi:helix-turn-helix transcriptional regulator [Nitratireductor mangrovi]|uniref:Helix-turn-helix transcriptional regulator n=1 Tax=Nitratireductor mangrovi TaxID=2599600 RepID=A0A5B8L308_9HYPH|nr:helix-turn-helix domain-containing protein [Nitratireductor mangrovi]QDZ02010.1 helix-turn-helix transcriptional regulator [Nitratireductor mangrovi]